MRRIAALERKAAIPLTKITDQKIKRFSKAIAKLLPKGDIAFRQSYLRQFIDSIEAKGVELHISGSEDALAATVATAPNLADDEVHAFVHEWRAVDDESANRWIARICINASRQSVPNLESHHNKAENKPWLEFHYTGPTPFEIHLKLIAKQGSNICTCIKSKRVWGS